MLKIILKIIPALFFWGTFVFASLQIPYPDSLTQANVSQLIPFFGSLFLAIIFTLNIFLKNIFLSLSLALGLIFLLILKALDSLNFVTAFLVLLSVGLLFSYFWKRKNRIFLPYSGFKNLTKQTKISKLTGLRKQKNK